MCGCESHRQACWREPSTNLADQVLEVPSGPTTRSPRSGSGTTRASTRDSTRRLSSVMDLRILDTAGALGEGQGGALMGQRYDSAERQEFPAPMVGTPVEVGVQTAFGHALGARHVDQLTGTLGTVQGQCDRLVRAFHRAGDSRRRAVGEQSVKGLIWGRFSIICADMITWRASDT